MVAEARPPVTVFPLLCQSFRAMNCRSMTWWDTLAGKQLATGEATASGGVLKLSAPAFQVDIAAHIQKR